MGGWCSLPYRMEDLNPVLPGKPAAAAGARSSARLLFLDGTMPERLPDQLRAQKGATNPVPACEDSEAAMADVCANRGFAGQRDGSRAFLSSFRHSLP